MENADETKMKKKYNTQENTPRRENP